MCVYIFVFLLRVVFSIQTQGQHFVFLSIDVKRHYGSHIASHFQVLGLTKK